MTGVSAHLELFERAAAAGAQMVLCHHGIFWGKQPRRDRRAQRSARLEALFDADMSLAAYHLPLDAHPEVGNNALICEALGLERGEPFGDRGGRPIGWVGRAPEPLAARRADRALRGARSSREPLAFDVRPRSGAHGRRRVGRRRVDARRGGRRSGSTRSSPASPRSPAMADAREGGIHFIAGGHYATETFGVSRLGELVAERFGVEHRFLEIPNPV